MDTIPWLAISIGLLLLGLLVVGVMVYRYRDEPIEPDYRTFFILGVIWLPLGLGTDNPAFWIIGLAFMAIGLANHAKWKDAPRWRDLPDHQRRVRLVVLGVILGLVLLTGLILVYQLILG